jgi:tetratricopeptide (TPR) repeat protein
VLYKEQGRYAEAEPFSKRALAIDENALGADHPRVARDLNNLASLYHSQGHYAESEPLYKRSLMIYEKAFGPNHPDVTIALNNLALIYYERGSTPMRYRLFAPQLSTKPLRPGLRCQFCLARRASGSLPQSGPSTTVSMSCSALAQL